MPSEDHVQVFWLRLLKKETVWTLTEHQGLFKDKEISKKIQILHNSVFSFVVPRSVKTFKSYRAQANNNRYEHTYIKSSSKKKFSDQWLLFFINISEDYTSKHQCYSSDDITLQKLLISSSIEFSFLSTYSQHFICCNCHFSHFSPEEKWRENANNCMFRTHEGWSVLWHLSSLMTRDNSGVNFLSSSWRKMSYQIIVYYIQQNCYHTLQRKGTSQQRYRW